jgi:molybdopterin synthase sulfur carrier subunit
MRILFFASLKETLNCGELTIDHSEQLRTVNDLLDLLSVKGEPWQSALENNKILVAINQEIGKRGDPIAPNDEIALFPPVTGG